MGRREVVVFWVFLLSWESLYVSVEQLMLFPATMSVIAFGVWVVVLELCLSLPWPGEISSFKIQEIDRRKFSLPSAKP